MPTPEITLTATLQDFTGAADDKGALIICLCGYGQTLPHIAGTSMLAKVGPLTFILQTGTTTPPIMLWGNDQISPPGTFYAISIMDEKKNVVQTGIYQFTPGGPITIDLSNAPQIIGPQPIPGLPNFRAEAVLGAFPGTVYTLPHQPFFSYLIALFYNGGYLRPFVDYTLAGSTITLTFATQNGDNLYALYISAS